MGGFHIKLRPEAVLVAAAGAMLAAGVGVHVATATPRTVSPQMVLPAAQVYGTSVLADVGTGSRTGATEIEAGRKAMARGDRAGADAAYRSAWRDPGSRQEAAAALSELARVPGAALRADEDAVGRLRRLVGPAFVRFDTPHFVIVSDCAPEWTAARGDLLERARSQFYRVADRLGTPVYPHAHKLLCVLFHDHDKYQAFARAQDGLEAKWVAGYYATLSNRVVFYNDASSPAYEAARVKLKGYEQQMRQTRERAEEAVRQRNDELARRLHASADDLAMQIKRERDRIGEKAAASAAAKTLHEAVHLLAFNCGLQLPDRDYPFWLSEGLASSFETDRPHGAFGPDRPWVTGTRKGRFEELRRDGRLAPLGELVRVGDVPRWDGETADAMYSQGYALFGALFQQDPLGMGRYIQSLGDEPPGRISPERQVELFVAAFGDIDEVDRRVLRGGR